MRAVLIFVFESVFFVAVLGCVSLSPSLQSAAVVHPTRSVATDRAESPIVGPEGNASKGAPLLKRLLAFQRDFDLSSSNPTRNIKVIHRHSDEKANQSFLLKRGHCKVEVLILMALDPLTEQPGGLQVRVYEPGRAVGTETLSETEGKGRQILILPPTGGENPLDLAYADAFCARGIRTAVLERWDGDTNNEIDLDSHDRGALRSLAAVRHAVEFLAPSHPRQLGILGTSVGALTAVLAAGYEPRLSAAALIVGGIGLSEIIPVSDERNLKRLKYERIASLQLSGQLSASEVEYQQAMRQHLAIEPGDSLANTQLKSAWLMIAEQDATVPTATQMALKAALTQLLGAENVTVQSEPGNHLSTIKKTFEHVDSMIRYFLKVLVP
jgi:dienelactone hydrolase